MLCANCKKRQATIYINEPTENDKNHLVGYCHICAKEKGITSVVFDRGGFRYIGRVKALAEAAREAGLEF